MIELIALGFVLYLFYYLFIKGVAWPILLFVIGIGGGRILVKQWFPITSKIAATIFSIEISWAAIICFLIIVMALGVVMGDD